MFGLRQRNNFYGLLLGMAILGVAAFGSLQINAEEFKDAEIRVIREKYFQKSGRFELGAQMTAIMNETFVYTFMATGLMTFHFGESFAFEALGSYGFSVERSEKEVLFDQFRIRTQIFRTQYLLEGTIQYTPIYGKWQLPSGDLIYFDTFVAAGGGLTGIFWKYSDFCVPLKEEASAQVQDIPADQTKGYPTFSIGLGQRYFISKKTSIKWDIRNHTIIYNLADTACDPAIAQSGTDSHNNVTMAIGASKYF